MSAGYRAVACSLVHVIIHRSALSAWLRGSDACVLHALLTLCGIILTGDDMHTLKLDTRQFCSN